MALLQQQNNQLQEQRANAKQALRPMSAFPGFEYLYPGTSNCRPPALTAMGNYGPAMNTGGGASPGQTLAGQQC